MRRATLSLHNVEIGWSRLQGLGISLQSERLKHRNSLCLLLFASFQYYKMPAVVPCGTMWGAV